MGLTSPSSSSCDPAPPRPSCTSTTSATLKWREKKAPVASHMNRSTGYANSASRCGGDAAARGAVRRPQARGRRGASCRDTRYVPVYLRRAARTDAAGSAVRLVPRAQQQRAHARIRGELKQADAHPVERLHIEALRHEAAYHGQVPAGAGEVQRRVSAVVHVVDREAGQQQPPHDAQVALGPTRGAQMAERK